MIRIIVIERIWVRYVRHAICNMMRNIMQRGGEKREIKINYHCLNIGKGIDGELDGNCSDNIPMDSRLSWAVYRAWEGVEGIIII